jgi:hypothetical protein
MENQSNSATDDAPAKKGRRSKKDGQGDDGKKRRCISSACVPCRKRKSKVRTAAGPAAFLRLRSHISGQHH